MGTSQVETQHDVQEELLAADDVFEGELVKEATKWALFRALIRQSLLLKIALLITATGVFLAIFGPTIAPYSPTTATGPILEAPSASHWFGTDDSGFDVFSRVLVAPRIDISIALFATLLSLAFGSIIGLFASFFRGWGGELVVRISDTLQGFPLFVLAIIIVIGSGRKAWTVILVIAILQAPIYLRLMRSQVLSLRERTFVEAARANGDYGASIALRHVLPNSLAPAFAQASITFGQAILLTAGLSFIGAGIQPPTAEWGRMIAAGKDGIIIGQWWPSVFPGIVMSLTVFGFAYVGETLQDIYLRRVK